MGSRGHPRRAVTVMYATWTLATLAIVGYGIATAAWQLMLACLVFNALRDRRHDRLGDDQAVSRPERHAGPRLEPRLVDLDRPASHIPALTAPISAVVGARATLVGAGIIGAAITLAALFLPGMRDIEREPIELSQPLDEA